MSLIKVIQFPTLGDHRGSLIAIESKKTIPFEIQRIYYLFDTKEGVSRGFHAHRDIEQVAVCVMGSCRFLLDDGFKREEVLLNSSREGLIIEKGIWHEMHDFSSDCVLLVAANKHYDENDYIRNYEQFLEFVNFKD